MLGRDPVTILEPCAGDGVFLRLARQRFPHAALAGWELGGSDDPAVRQGDFLVEPPQPVYDLVVGNPPWVSFSGRHTQPGAPAPGRGWPALHSRFTDRAAQWVAPGGVLAFVAPVTMSHQRGYAPVRERLLADGELHFEEGGRFPGVTMPCCLLLWRRVGRTGAVVPPVRAKKRLFADAGVHTGNARRELIHGDHAPGREPILVGRDVTAYAQAAPSLYLQRSLLRQGRYARVPSAESQGTFPILLRQTASRPIAALHDPPLPFRNSLIACRSLEGHSPHYIIAVLNSLAVALFHRCLNPDSRQTAFPQVKVGDLERLPIRSADGGAASAEGLALANHWLRSR